MTKQILLSNKEVALVDDADFDWINQWRWRVCYAGSTYAMRHRSKLIGRKTLYMHRVITSAPKGMEVDHINGNGLDNRRENLRICTHAENIRNSRLQSNNTSGFKGVTFVKARGVYQARIKVNGEKISLGYFSSAEEAARAYDQAAKTFFGEFARQNFA